MVHERASTRGWDAQRPAMWSSLAAGHRCAGRLSRRWLCDLARPDLATPPAARQARRAAPPTALCSSAGFDSLPASLGCARAVREGAGFSCGLGPRRLQL